LQVEINERRLSVIHDNFNELTKPIPLAMKDLIRQVESSENSYADFGKSHDSKLGPSVGRHIKDNKKTQVQKGEYLTEM